MTPIGRRGDNDDAAPPKASKDGNRRRKRDTTLTTMDEHRGRSAVDYDGDEITNDDVEGGCPLFPPMFPPSLTVAHPRQVLPSLAISN